MLSRFSIFNNMSTVEIGATLGGALAFAACVIKLVADGHFEASCDPNCGPIAHAIVDTMTTAAGTFSGIFFGALGSGVLECFKSESNLPITFSPESKEERKLRSIYLG
jgi:hypothetical protein